MSTPQTWVQAVAQEDDSFVHMNAICILCHALNHNNKKLDLACHQLAKMANEDYARIELIMEHQRWKLCKDMLILINSSANDQAIVSYMYLMDGVETGIEFTCVLICLEKRLGRSWQTSKQLDRYTHPEVVAMNENLFKM